MPADEVLTMGRIGVDLYPQQIGVSLREVRTFAKFLGGSPTNVAVAAARYGRRSAVITRTGADPFGEFLHDALRGFGVDVDLVGADLKVRGARFAIEVQRKVVGREDLAERDRGRVLDVSRDVAIVDTKRCELGADKRDERIVADAGDQRRAVSQPRRGHRHIGGAAAQKLAERRDVLQSDTGL